MNKYLTSSEKDNNKNQSRNPIILHTTASHGASYLFKTIDAAIWLLSQEQIVTNGEKKGKTLSEVEIILHPVGGDITLQSKLKGFKSKTKAFLSYWLKGSFLASKSSSISKEKPLSVYDQVYKAKETVSLETELGNIKIHISTKSLGYTLSSWKRCYSQALRMWRSCHNNEGQLIPQKFLSLDYQGIVIGDLIASKVLRSNPEAGGSLQTCPKLFQGLVKALFICDYISHDIKDTLEKSCVLVPEPTYLHGIYKRLLHHQGAKVLEPHHYATEFKLVEPSEPIPNPRIADPCLPRKLSETEQVRAQTYLHERIYDPQKHLWYMFQGYNQADKNALDINGNLIVISDDKLSAVVFLHSFDDGQYWYGVDGFDDIYHWTVFTIDNLIENSEVEKVIIKQHPNVNYSAYPGDKVAAERLKSRYQNSPKVSWLQKDCSLLGLSQLGCLVGITHHGSVAEELTFLGIPVVASTFAPWGNNYKFVQTWGSPSKYYSLLNNLSIENWKQPSSEAIDHLYKFILEYRLDTPPKHNRTTWMKYGKLMEENYPEIKREVYLKYTQKLASLNIDDNNFKRFLSVLIESRIKSKRNGFAELSQNNR